MSVNKIMFWLRLTSSETHVLLVNIFCHTQRDLETEICDLDQSCFTFSHGKLLPCARKNMCHWDMM